MDPVQRPTNDVVQRHCTHLTEIQYPVLVPVIRFDRLLVEDCLEPGGEGFVIEAMGTECGRSSVHRDDPLVCFSFDEVVEVAVDSKTEFVQFTSSGVNTHESVWEELELRVTSTAQAAEGGIAKVGMIFLAEDLIMRGDHPAGIHAVEPGLRFRQDRDIETRPKHDFLGVGLG
ncbi:hypothetical protein [Sulfidibacter corallicola]|uniref:Uncharacterized protein n=1 Tax=Sulfidibacter corallicola TaxID=2818388 RepID=A0A8A4TU33_SULCO|nr:hypothetical protein [Sulfidibacter corallicola]QTD53469.1 hypothetical protein J3U87_13525 [Sulfidibacter corallicola]